MKGNTVQDTNTTEITVINHMHQFVTHEARTDDEWDRDSTDCSHDIRGIIKSSSGLYDLIVDFPVIEGKPYYLVYAIYGTGDSFGRDDGQIEYIDLFLNKSVAEACVESARKTRTDYEEKGAYIHSYTYLNDSLKLITARCPWIGYFEHLEDVSVKIVYLE